MAKNGKSIKQTALAFAFSSVVPISYFAHWGDATITML